ncbi:conserved hypothetical protein [Teredinibacter turnerae T7901]|uniref:Peptidase M14 domain-containing protein n=1 Tax=Teredinibacter turnerae (strain ATCC 39867 / T7901) TaxID=377629 RepID=C5BLD6_TERTT|nr:DUF2817 domain-containing protein [Teredinibacter turnerae]ACR13433.1 conserved hypothetical protein [Teredinibacter turnerae T7901]
MKSVPPVQNPASPRDIKLALPKRPPQERKRLKKALPELLWLERLINTYSSTLDASCEGLLPWQGLQLPFYCLTLGGSAADKKTPVLLITGGVHGIERIGSQVILAWLSSLLSRLEWDSALQQKLSRLRLVVVPIVNPVGMFANRRANGNGVDLNRNGLVTAEDKVPFLVGGHRIGSWLPWYRGSAGQPQELEYRLLQQVVEREVYPRAMAMALDLHSGFGTHDRLWFPYAYRKKLIGSIENYLALKLLWERCFPHHNYIFEPQSIHYLSHGDIWDDFYLQAKKRENHTFIPLTLEMGSWAWVKKRPAQIFNFAGMFNPQKAHRHSRVLRRHLSLLDFLLSAAIDYREWLPVDEQVKLLKQAAHVLWN